MSHFVLQNIIKYNRFKFTIYLNNCFQ